jgi:drug/metabolite transporter (DMT)-like permease
MLAILGGTGAALAFAGSTMCSSRSAKLIGPFSVAACMMLVGLVVTVPLAAAQGVPHFDAANVTWLLVGGAGNVLGLVITYYALRSGKVGVVAPIVSTEGAVTAVLATATGEPLGAATGVLLLVVAVGVVLAGRQAEPGAGSLAGRPAILAFAAALAFGASLLAIGRAAETVPLWWSVLPARVIGAVALALPLALAGRLRLTRRAAPFVIASGLCEVAGLGAYALGARDGIAVAAVLASLFGALAAVLAAVLFGERLARVQVAGVGTIAAGVALLTALQA